MRFYRKEKRKLILLLIFIIMAIFLCTIDMALRPTISQISEIQAENIATSLISKCVNEEMEFGKYCYSDFAILSKNEYGEIIALQMNMPKINQLYNNLLEKTSEEFKKMSSQIFQISLGSLSGSNLLIGKGPNVKFRLIPVGNVEAKITSNFTTAGINQTLHEIVLEIKCEVKTVIPLHKNKKTVEARFILASTVIVGEIPENYLKLPQN